MEIFDEALIKKVLNLYLERCVFQHSLAFFQYRATVPGLEYQTEELKEIFKDRQNFMLRVLSKIDSLIKLFKLENLVSPPST